MALPNHQPSSIPHLPTLCILCLLAANSFGSSEPSTIIHSPFPPCASCAFWRLTRLALRNHQPSPIPHLPLCASCASLRQNPGKEYPRNARTLTKSDSREFAVEIPWSFGLGHWTFSPPPFPPQAGKRSLLFNLFSFRRSPRANSSSVYIRAICWQTSSSLPTFALTPISCEFVPFRG